MLFTCPVSGCDCGWWDVMLDERHCNENPPLIQFWIILQTYMKPGWKSLTKLKRFINGKHVYGKIIPGKYLHVSIVSMLPC